MDLRTSAPLRMACMVSRFMLADSMALTCFRGQTSSCIGRRTGAHLGLEGHPAAGQPVELLLVELLLPQGRRRRALVGRRVGLCLAHLVLDLLAVGRDKHLGRAALTSDGGRGWTDLRWSSFFSSMMRCCRSSTMVSRALSRWAPDPDPRHQEDQVDMVPALLGSRAQKLVVVLLLGVGESGRVGLRRTRPGRNREKGPGQVS